MYDAYRDYGILIQQNTLKQLKRIKNHGLQNTLKLEMLVEWKRTEAQEYPENS